MGRSPVPSAVVDADPMALYSGKVVKVTRKAIVKWVESSFETRLTGRHRHGLWPGYVQARKEPLLNIEANVPGPWRL